MWTLTIIIERCVLTRRRDAATSRTGPDQVRSDAAGDEHIAGLTLPDHLPIGAATLTQRPRRSFSASRMSRLRARSAIGVDSRVLSTW